MSHLLRAVVLVVVAAISAVPGQAAGTRAADATGSTGPTATAGTGSLAFVDGGRDFGVVTVGTSAVSSITILNDDTGAVTGLTISIDHPGASGFAIGKIYFCATATVPGRSSCEINLRFTPAAIGASTPATIRARGVGTDGSTVEAVATLTGWGTSWVKRDIPEFTTAGGADLGSTLDGDTRYVHVVVSNIEEGWPAGDHADDASEYLRTRSDGRRWGNRLLIGGIVPRLAASGRNVYLAYEAYACGDGIAVRRNDDHGRRGAWSPVICLTRNAELDSMWGPDIAAAGRFVYVVSRSRPLHAAVVRVSRDHGRTWTHASLGHATGAVVVAASGRLAVVAWMDRGVSYARLSVDGGRHWRPRVRLSAGRVTSVAVHGTRVAVGGTGRSTLVWVRAWSAGSGWHAVPPPVAGSWGTQVLLRGRAGLAVSVCSPRPDYPVRYASAWSASADDGASWSQAELMPPSDCEDPLLWTSDGRAYALVNGNDGEGYGLGVR